MASGGRAHYRTKVDKTLPAGTTARGFMPTSIGLTAITPTSSCP